MSGYYGDAYLINSQARLFVVDSDPDAGGVDLVGAPAFSLMTPIVIVRNPYGSGERAAIKEFLLHQQNTPSQVVHVRAMLDRADTYVALSGVERTPRQPNGSTASEKTTSIEVYDEEPELEDAGFIDDQDVTSDPMGAGLRSLAVGAGDDLGCPIGGGIIVNPGQICAFYAWNGGGTQVTCRYQLRFIVDTIPS